MSDVSIKAFNTSIFDRVLDGGSFEEKRNLTEQLGLLACDMESARVERDAIVPTLLRLAVDPIKGIRSLLASILVHAVELHPDLVFSIIADDEDISLPFLAETPALDRLRTLAVLKVGDKARQLVLASREGLADEAIKYIVENCDSEVCSALLDNEKIEVNTQNYRRLYVRFRDVPEIIEQLLDRHDLPLEVRILQAKRASNNVHKLMAERGWIPANDAEEIIVDAEETTLLKILSSAKQNELDGLIPFLSSKNLLTPSLILRAALSNKLAIVSRAIAYLSSTPMVKLERMFADNAVMAIKSSYNKAGLPKSCFHIIRAALDASNELKEVPDRLAKQQFGPRLVEYLMTRYSSVSAQDKSMLLEIVGRLSDDNTRALARRLAEQFKLAA